MPQPAAVLSILVTANTTQATTGLTKLNTQLQGTSKQANQTIMSMKSLAKGAAIGAATAAAYKAVGAFVDFDKGMRNVNSIAKLSEDRFDKLSKNVLKLAGPTAQAPKTLAEGLYQLVSSGFKANDAIKVLEKSAIAATAGLTDTATATQVIAASINAYGLAAEDAGKVSDILFKTVDRGVLSFEDLAQQLGPILPSARGLAVSLEQVGAAMATLTKQGFPAAEAATAIDATLRSLLKPSDALKKAFKELGVEGGEQLIKKYGNLQRALVALRATTDGSGTGFRKLFNEQRAGRGVMALTGDQAKKAAADLKALGDASGSTAAAFKEQSKSASVQWAKLKAELEVFAVTVGTVLFPVLRRALIILLAWDKILIKLPQLWIAVGVAGVNAAKAIWGAISSTFKRVEKVVGDAMAFVLRQFAKLFDVASHLPGIGDKFGKLRDKANALAERVDKAGEKTKTLGYEIKKLPANKRINIKVDASVGTIEYGGFNPLTGRPQDAPAAGGPGSILDQIGGAVAGKVDGKKLLAQAGAPGSAPGKLGMLEGLGHRMGLYTSSGYRPGDTGFHGQNRARDMAGSPANMLAYARMLYNTYGTSIDELIHTPLGVGIDAHRAGQLTSLYPAATLADHYDHVHVAMAEGGRANRKVRALVGEEGPEIVDLPVGAFVHTASKSKAMMASMKDRIAAFAAGGKVGTFGSTSYGPPWGGINGMGVTATGVDLTRSPHLHGIAVDPNVLKLGSKYWLSPNPFGYKGPFKAFDTGGAIKGNRVDFYDWRGRDEQYGWGRRNVTVYGSDPFGAVKKIPKKAAEKLAKIVKPKKKGTLNRKPYGGIGKSGILNAFIDFQTNRLNMWSALAALNDVEGDPSTFLDDIAVATDAVKTWETWLNVAQLNNIPEGITTTATNLKSARDRLRELTTPDTSAADAAAAALAAERSGLLEQLLREANQRTAVSQAQYGVLRNFGGSFAEGGVVPGPMGMPQMIVAHGGETVTPPGASNVQVIVNGDIVNTPRGKKPVEIRDIRGSGRAPLPGGGGGWH